MKWILYLLGEKGYECLISLSGDKVRLVSEVIIGRDTNVENDFSEVIQKYCKEKKIPFSFKDSSNADIGYKVAIGWRKLIKVSEGQKLIVLHDSLLPKYRGFNPLVTAMIKGDTEIGVTAIFGEENYDTGAIIAVERTTVKYPIKISEVIKKISVCYVRLMNLLMENIEQLEEKAIPQNEKEATYSLWRDKEDYRIQWNWDAEKISRMIDAVGNPYDGAKTMAEGKIYTISEATIIKDVVIENRVPRKVIFKENGKPVVVCGSGLLRLDSVLDAEDNVETFEKQFRLRFT